MLMAELQSCRIMHSIGARHEFQQLFYTPPPSQLRHKKKCTKNPRQGSNKANIVGVPIFVVTGDFVTHQVLPSFTTLDSSVGLRMHVESAKRKEVTVDLKLLLGNFFT
jgi:hypothetical protein